MTIDKKYKTFFEYRYLIDNILKKYSNNKYNYEQLYDAGISGLFRAIDSYENTNSNDFEAYATFNIKSAINVFLNENYNNLI